MSENTIIFNQITKIVYCTLCTFPGLIQFCIETKNHEKKNQNKSP